MKRKTLTVCCLITVLLLLTDPAKATSYAYQGLILWFERMVPALFPFMMVSGILVSYGLLSDFLTLFRIPMRLLFRLPDSCLYTILAGFFCGFPMGAKTVADLYRRGSLTVPQAQYLLGFCNNIGPVYFISFAYPLLSGIAGEKMFPLPVCLFGMYGFPLLYGILTQRRLTSPQKASAQSARNIPDTVDTPFDAIITNSLESMTKLAGYMIFFNMLMVWVNALYERHLLNRTALSVCSLLLEITGGLNTLKEAPLIGLLALQFGGISCIFQTGGMIARTPLSLSKYVRTRLLLTALTGLYYLVLLFFMSF